MSDVQNKNFKPLEHVKHCKLAARDYKEAVLEAKKEDNERELK